MSYLRYGWLLLLLSVTLLAEKPWHRKYFEEGRVSEITGLKFEPGWRENPNSYFLDIKASRALPSEYDLRTLLPNGLPPIRRQQCGDCWAQSVVATLETLWAFKNPSQPFSRYSVQEFISNCGNTGGTCNGGYFRAFDYGIGKTGPGLPLEQDLPYKGYQTSCNSTVQKKPRGVKWWYVGSRENLRGASTEQLKQALYDYGIISVSVCAFDHTGSGIYNRCTLCETDHMVNIVGWHDFQTQAEKDEYGSDGYWIMRNSWGTTFGDGGYAKVPYTDRYGRKCNRLAEVSAVAQVEGSPAPAAPTCTLAADPSQFIIGQSTTLRMSIQGSATSAQINGETVPISTPQKIEKPTSTGVKTANASVTGLGGTTTCSTTYTVTDEVTPPAPTCRLTANPWSIILGQSLTLQIEAQGQVNSARINGTPVVFPIGSLVITPNQTGTAIGEVIGNGGSGTCGTSYTVTEEVDPTPPSCELVANPSTVIAGANIQLTLTMKGTITQAFIDDTAVSVPVGVLTVRPAAGAYFSWGSVEGPKGKANCWATYNVQGFSLRRYTLRK